MPKQGEIDYLKNIGQKGVRHAVNKPFSDPDCGRYLMEIGAVLALLPPPPARLLDLGCGTGWTSCFFAKRGYDVTGQDIAADMIYHANVNKDQYQLANVDFVVCDYEDLDFIAEFDCAVFFDSLHHAVNEDKAVGMAYRALKPGGVCVTSEPGCGHSRSASSVEAIKRFNVTERDMPPGRIIRAGKAAGFRVFKIYPHPRHLKQLLYGEVAPSPMKSLIQSSSFLQGLALAFLASVYKRYNGIVLMTK